MERKTRASSLMGDVVLKSPGLAKTSFDRNARKAEAKTDTTPYL
jgi:hypothetical protein